MIKKKPPHLGLKLAMLGLFSGLLLLWVAMDWPCVIRSLTGIPCPMCGMSRAWLSALRLDFAAAFSYHPMFWSVPLLIIYLIYDGQPLKNRHLNYGILSLLILGFLLGYVVKMIFFLSGTVPV